MDVIAGIVIGGTDNEGIVIGCTDTEGR